MKTQNVIRLKITSAEKSAHLPKNHKAPVINFTLFVIKRYLAKADYATLCWFLAELESEKLQTNAQ